MNLEQFSEFTLDNLWIKIIPEILLGVSVLIILLYECFYSKNKRNYSLFLSVMFLILIVGILAYHQSDFNWLNLKQYTDKEYYFFFNTVKHNFFNQVIRIIFLVNGLLVINLIHISLKSKKACLASTSTENYCLVVLSTAMGMLSSQSNSLLLLFVTLEAININFYTLITYPKKIKFLNAGLKYIILSMINSIVLLIGISIFYGIASSSILPGSTTQPLSFNDLREFISYNLDNNWIYIAIIFVLGSVSFKIGVAPFQIWIPDVYEGTPTTSMMITTILPKLVGSFVLINLTGFLFLYLHITKTVLCTLITLSIFTGTLTSIGEQNIKRLIASSGVVHSGFLMTGIMAIYVNCWAKWIIVLYLMNYLISLVSIFIVLIITNNEYIDIRTLQKNHILKSTYHKLDYIINFGLNSLAGIPPLFGFLCKTLIIIVAYQSNHCTLLALLVVSIILSTYYYFNWIKKTLFRVSFFKENLKLDVHYLKLNFYLNERYYWLIGIPSALIAFFGIFHSGLGFFLINKRSYLYFSLFM